MQKTLLALTLCLAAFGTSANTDNKRQLAAELTQISGAISAIKTGNQLVVQQIRLSVPPEVPEDFFEQLAKNLNNDAMLQDVIGFYAQHLTEDEIKASIAFYKTPAGQTMVAKTQLFTEYFSNLSMRYADNAMAATMQQFANHPVMKQLQQQPAE